jgi:hypothetical protein
MPIIRLSSLSQKERLLAGFILNKLWIYRYWCGIGRRQHLGHTPLQNLPKGRPRNEAGGVQAVAKKLRRWGFINIFSATGDKHVCACRATEIIREGLVVVNEYRSTVGLAPLSENEI